MKSDDIIIIRNHDIIKNYIILSEYLNCDEEPEFYKIDKQFADLAHPLYDYILFPVAREWCKENGIDPLNMSDEDMMAFILKFS